jgi:hypothetical protein
MFKASLGLYADAKKSNILLNEKSKCTADSDSIRMAKAEEVGLHDNNADDGVSRFVKFHGEKNESLLPVHTASINSS